MPEVEIEIKRKVITYSDFWTTSEILYGHGCDEEKGSYYLFLSSLVFSAFSLEAYLNHVGEHIFISWSDLEKLGIKAKLNVISERLDIEVDYGHPPWQVVPKLIGFRNKVAHGKTSLLQENMRIPLDAYESIRREYLETDWQKFATRENAEEARKQLKTVFEIIFQKANFDEDEFLFDYGGQEGSETLIR